MRPSMPYGVPGPIVLPIPRASPRAATGARGSGSYEDDAAPRRYRLPSPADAHTRRTRARASATPLSLSRTLTPSKVHISQLITGGKLSYDEASVVDSVSSSGSGSSRTEYQCAPSSPFPAIACRLVFSAEPRACAKSRRALLRPLSASARHAAIHGSAMSRTPIQDTPLSPLSNIHYIIPTAPTAIHTNTPAACTQARRSTARCPVPRRRCRSHRARKLH